MQSILYEFKFLFALIFCLSFSVPTTLLPIFPVRLMSRHASNSGTAPPKHPAASAGAPAKQTGEQIIPPGGVQTPLPAAVFSSTGSATFKPAGTILSGGRVSGGPSSSGTGSSSAQWASASASGGASAPTSLSTSSKSVSSTGGSSAAWSTTAVAPPASAPAASGPDLFEIVLKNDVALLGAYVGNIHTVDKHGFNALMVSAMHRCPAALMWCIRNGVGRTSIDKEERTEGLTPLMFACVAWSTNHTRVLDNPECARMLVEAGANVKRQNIKGDTALHWAVNSDFIEIVRYLSSLEADFPGLLELRNNGTGAKGGVGQTALEVAESKGKVDIAAVLREAQVRGRACPVATVCVLSVTITRCVSCPLVRM